MAWYDSIPGGSMVNSFLHPEEGYKAAADQMRKSWMEAQGFGKQGIDFAKQGLNYGERGLGFQDHFRQAGLDQTGRLNQAENRLLDPSSLLNEWMEKYNTSPFAQKSMQNANEAGLGAASKMGLMGSNAAVNNIQQSSGDIMNQDRPQYLNDLMNKYMSGVGIGQNIYNTGAATAGNMGNQALGMGNQALDIGRMFQHMGDQSLDVGSELGRAAYNEKNAGGSRLMDIGNLIARFFGGS